MNDSENPNDEEQYHLKLSADDVAPRVLLPGDPDRVDTISHQWDATETASLALHLLAKMDEKKAEHDCSHWNPFMSLSRS